ncbi:MAG TPA: D-sedoheptulose 7-phosphate isomerase [Acidobacteriaceae bacterium]|nr:D-sedoheptulose 7-phosphate isomerase [Acidobacteriaceae bacterium]
MQEIVRQQLTNSLSVMQQVIGDSGLIDAVAEAGSATARALLAGNKLMVAGNGGSAADAQHLVAEFVSRLTVDRPALRAVALTTDSSILTAIGNDYGYEHVFERQVEALGQPGDVFLGISTSGRSPNVVRALELCRRSGILTIGFSGNRGGAMAALCDYNIIIPSAVTQHIQECHLALEHIFCMIVERCYFGAEMFETPLARAKA